MKKPPLSAVGQRIRSIVMDSRLWNDETDEEIRAIGVLVRNQRFKWLSDEAGIMMGSKEYRQFTLWIKGYWNREMIRRKNAGIKNLTPVRLHSQ